MPQPQHDEVASRVSPLPVLTYQLYCSLGELARVLAMREKELTQHQRQLLARALEARSDTAWRMGWSL